MAKLTKESRDSLPEDDFAVPGKRALPMHDSDHVKMAWDTVGKTKGLTAAEQASARARIRTRAVKLGVNTKSWGKMAASVTLHAMSLHIDNDDGHPNKMPFSGVMTRVGKPSDEPPGGSGGKLITISLEAADKGLHTLLGMAVDYVPNLDGHDPRSKIGIITAATIEGDAILIEGFIYAADFPDVAAEIKASKDILGFSYECRDLFTNDPDANPCVITECTFTGAAILRKDKAAYHSTSIHANKEVDMTPEQEKSLKDLEAGQASLTKSLGDIAASIEKLSVPLTAANMLPKVEPHAHKMEACADAMEAAGIGGDPSNGHAVILRKMAGHIRSEGASGRLAAAFHGMYAAAERPVNVQTPDVAAVTAAAIKEATAPLTASLAAMTTQIADLKAAAVAKSTEPARKTATPEMLALLAKNGLTAPAGDATKIDMAAVDKALKDLPIGERLSAKAALHKAGMID